MTTPNDPTMSRDSLDSIIAAYMLAVEAGDVPNRQELLDPHPKYAGALRAFFADFDHMDRVASPLRLAGGVTSTSVVDADGHAKPPTVRYFGDYELTRGNCQGRDGRRLQGAAGVAQSDRGVEDDPPRAASPPTETSPGSAQRPRQRRTSITLTSCRSMRSGEHEGQQYYAMKFVEGTSLAKHPRSDLRREVDGMVAVSRAVHHAHQRGILHRDLKPSNVLVDFQGTPLVTDFGLAKRLAADDGSFTETGQVLGTPKYMAPEQAAGRKDLTVAADVYSLGVILYERLTGQTPFAGDNVLTLLRQVRESEPPRPSTIQTGLDRDLETVVLKCLEKEPLRRYLSALRWPKISSTG